MRRDPQKVGGVARCEASLQIRCLTRHDGRRIAKTKALELSTLANMVTSSECRESSFVAIVKFIMNLTASFVKEHEVPFHAAYMLDIVDDMVSADFQTVIVLRNSSAIFSW